MYVINLIWFCEKEIIFFNDVILELINFVFSLYFFVSSYVGGCFLGMFRKFL